MVISYYYKLLDRKEKGDFIKRVMDRCGISYPSVIKKTKDDSWTKLEKEAVEQIIKEVDDERSRVL